MGLIDKNEILNELRIGKSCEECQRYAKYGGPKDKCKGHLNWACRKIQNMKSVEAIPIEWIEEWQNKHEWKYQSYFTMKDGKPKYAIECMIEDWKKENETN